MHEMAGRPSYDGTAPQGHRSNNTKARQMDAARICFFLLARFAFGLLRDKRPGLLGT
jgi:hypothetical protein